MADEDDHRVPGDDGAAAARQPKSRRFFVWALGVPAAMLFLIAEITISHVRSHC